MLEVLVQKYKPEAFDNIFEYNAGSNSEWEKIEHRENLTKREIYQERADMPLSEIVG